MLAKKNIFDWDQDRYSIGVRDMDNQHQELIHLMNLLYQENEKKSAKRELIRIAGMLGLKTKEHFSKEEVIFSAIPNYPQAAAHKKIHSDLLARYQGHVDDFQKSAEQTMSDEFFRFLKVWLSAHICGIDRKYADLYNLKTA